MSARPQNCCGVCPPIASGGYDCTCQGNRNCPAFRVELNKRIRSVFESAIDCYAETTRKGMLEPCGKPAIALKWDDASYPYPVCKHHSRGDMVTVVEIEQAVRR